MTFTIRCEGFKTEAFVTGGPDWSKKLREVDKLHTMVPEQEGTKDLLFDLAVLGVAHTYVSERADAVSATLVSFGYKVSMEEKLF